MNCSDCAAAGRPSFIRWIGAPITSESAGEFTMPFGRYAGVRLAEVPSDYLRWVRDNLDAERIARRAALVLEGRARR
jgi:hypothetical protein